MRAKAFEFDFGYDQDQRSVTVGLYCRLALRQMDFV